MPYFVAWKSFRLPWYKATSATAIHRQTDRLGIDNNQQHCLKAMATMARIEALNFCNALLSMWHYHEWSLTYVLVCYFEWNLVYRQHTTHCWCCVKRFFINDYLHLNAISIYVLQVQSVLNQHHYFKSQCLPTKYSWVRSTPHFWQKLLTELSKPVCWKAGEICSG